MMKTWILMAVSLAAAPIAMGGDVPLAVTQARPSAVGVCPPLQNGETGHTLTVSTTDKFVPEASHVVVSKRYGGAPWIKTNSTETQFVASTPATANLQTGDSSWVISAGQFKIPQGGGKGQGGGAPAHPQWMAQATEAIDSERGLIIVNLYSNTLELADGNFGSDGLSTNDVFILSAKTIRNAIVLNSPPDQAGLGPYCGYCGPQKSTVLSPDVDSGTNTFGPIDVYTKIGAFLTAKGAKNNSVPFVISIGHGVKNNTPDVFVTSGTPNNPTWEKTDLTVWCNQVNPFLTQNPYIEFLHCYSGTAVAPNASPISVVKSKLAQAAPAISAEVVGIDGLGVVAKPRGGTDAYWTTAPGASFVSAP